jgi:hypothetical protein
MPRIPTSSSGDACQHVCLSSVAEQFSKIYTYLKQKLFAFSKTEGRRCRKSSCTVRFSIKITPRKTEFPSIVHFASVSSLLLLKPAWLRSLEPAG